VLFRSFSDGADILTVADFGFGGFGW
jgi:hypothetical protein